MLFNSIEFLIFLPIVVAIFYLCPIRFRQLWLLVSSYYFYMCWNAEYALLILFSTCITYLSGIVLDRNIRFRFVNRKTIVAISLLLNIAVLGYFKYTNFALQLVGDIMSFVGIKIQVPTYDILLPVGISFYTFQALSYTIDVYRGDVTAEHNFIKYALFVSFFPQLVAGPIERSHKLLNQLNFEKRFSYDKFIEGSMLMIWGYFLKLVLADRIAIFVDTIYGDFYEYEGSYLIVATILFAIQIYCDFSGYSTIAKGTALILGVELTDNFYSPYLATTVSGFWRGWHISLTTWFRDYLYIPLGGNRKGKLRKYINKIIVFCISGLWHGANMSYIVWGGLNGIYQVVGELLLPFRDKMVLIFNLHRTSFGHKLTKCIFTFCLVDFSWIFFRADSCLDALRIIRSMFTRYNPWILFDGSLFNCGLDRANFTLMICCILVLLLSDYLKLKGIVIRERLMRQDVWFKTIIFAFSIDFILTFGVWGPIYNEASFIYFQF